jgi:hypothetical protein
LDEPTESEGDEEADADYFDQRLVGKSSHMTSIGADTRHGRKKLEDMLLWRVQGGLIEEKSPRR